MDSNSHDAEARARFSRSITEMGIAGIVLRLCQRTEVYGFGPVPASLGGGLPLIDAEAARHLIGTLRRV